MEEGEVEAAGGEDGVGEEVFGYEGWFVCVCVWVWVCGREREKERLN
jgi:hypothetical protein